MRTHEFGLHILDKRITGRRNHLVLEAIATFNKLPVSALQAEVPILFYDTANVDSAGHYSHGWERHNRYINVNTNPEVLPRGRHMADEVLRIICHELGHYYQYTHFPHFTGYPARKGVTSVRSPPKGYYAHPSEKFANHFASLARKGLTIEAIHAGMAQWIAEGGYEN